MKPYQKKKKKKKIANSHLGIFFFFLNRIMRSMLDLIKNRVSKSKELEAPPRQSRGHQGI